MVFNLPQSLERHAYDITGQLLDTISGLTLDSREVKPGYLFAAFQGAEADGKAYIPQAIEQGASVILSDAAVEASVPVITAPQPKQLLGAIARAFYGPHPEQIVAVTGTNGKTSVAHFCRQLWAGLGQKAANLGTTGTWVQEPGKKAAQFALEDNQLTSPDIIGLHRMLAALKREGVEHVALEASSHGLYQERLSGVDILAGAFTNISRDHLDYHKTFENYLAAKLKLFELTDRKVVHDSLCHPERVQRAEGSQVVPQDSSTAIAIAISAQNDMLTYGPHAEDVAYTVTRRDATGIAATIHYDKKDYAIYLPLLGAFQLDNALCASALLIQCGEAAERLFPLFEGVTPVRGRMEQVAQTAAGANVLVDYAHTPDALAHALATLREHIGDGKLWVVFGCGGDRDAGKRPEMGKVAAELADQVMITDDNPRTEDAAAIRAAIKCEAPDAVEIADRREAIADAVLQAGAGDLVLIAGKGHENYQIIGTRKQHFDDAEVVRDVISAGQ